ncbi:MAG TPA: tetratricopeptide repeat protein [Bacteroidia bacterium]|nr:tetratricopeptide repeat protein [Bacteroidia bacterium]
MNYKFIVKYFIVILFLGSAHYVSLAQENSNTPVQHIIDSLKRVLNTYKDDTIKVITLNRLSNKLEVIGNYDSSMVYAGKAMVLAEKIEYKRGLARAFGNMGNNYIDQGDYGKALGYQNKALAINQEIGSKEGIASAYTNIANIYWYQGNYPKALEYGTNALSIVQEVGDKNGIAIQLGNIGNIYSSQGNFPKALEYDLKALKLTQEIGDKIGIAGNLGNIGNIYYYQMNYSNALEYDLKALAAAREIGDKEGIATNLGNIANIYFDQKKLSEALDYYSKALAMSQELGDKGGVAINMANMGNIYYAQGDYEKALEYHNKALSISREMGDKSEMGGIFTDLGRTSIKQKNFKQAKMFLDSSLYISQKIGDKKREESAFSVFAMLDSATGNFKTAFEDYKTFTLYHDSLINKEDIKKITQLEVSYQFEKREDSIHGEQEKTDIIETARSNRKSIITYSSILIALLTAILAIVLINRQQIKRKKDKALFEQDLILSEKEKDLLKLERQRMEDELKNSQNMLNDFTQNMVEKNKLLEEFKIDLEKLTILKSKEIDEARVEHLEHLNKVTILTEDDWTKFKNLFEQVYKGFFIRLKEKLPDLTQAEIRLVCLTKLNLDTKQMAGILGVSFATIRQSRYRMRKKLGLSEEGGIEEILESL